MTAVTTERRKKQNVATELFTRVNHLEQDTSSIKTKIDGIESEVGDVKNTLNQLVQMVTQQGKPNYMVVISAFTLLIMIVMPVIYGINSDNNRTEAILIKHMDTFSQYISQAHQTQVENAKESGRTEAIAEYNQYEIRLMSQRQHNIGLNRFTDADGDKLSSISRIGDSELRNDLQQRIEHLEDLVISHQLNEK